MAPTFLSRFSLSSAFKRGQSDGYATEHRDREPESPLGLAVDEKEREKERDGSSEDGEVTVDEAGLNPGGLSLEEGV